MRKPIRVLTSLMGTSFWFGWVTKIGSAHTVLGTEMDGMSKVVTTS